MADIKHKKRRGLIFIEEDETSKDANDKDANDKDANDRKLYQIALLLERCCISVASIEFDGMFCSM